MAGIRSDDEEADLRALRATLVAIVLEELRKAGPMAVPVTLASGEVDRLAASLATKLDEAKADMARQLQTHETAVRAQLLTQGQALDVKIASMNDKRAGAGSKAIATELEGMRKQLDTVVSRLSSGAEANDQIGRRGTLARVEDSDSDPIDTNWDASPKRKRKGGGVQTVGVPGRLARWLGELDLVSMASLAVIVLVLLFVAIMTASDMRTGDNQRAPSAGSFEAKTGPTKLPELIVETTPAKESASPAASEPTPKG